MRLRFLEFHDKVLNWRLERMSFDRLTLLVGASGVGKTKILNSLLALKDVAMGRSINGLKWKVGFDTSGGDRFEWECEFDNDPIADETWDKSDLNGVRSDTEERRPAAVVFETMVRNNETVISRDGEEIVFSGKSTVRLPEDKSVVWLLKREDVVRPAYQGFRSILVHEDRIRTLDMFDSNEALDNYPDIKAIRRVSESIRTKLFLASRNAPDVFDEIRATFISVFPYVEDLKIEPVIFTNDPRFETTSLEIKETGVRDLIKSPQLSAGMLRTLLHIAELYLCPDGTVILVDEFENSLGVNCIDEVTNLLMNRERDMQFIITSHHPYVINNISSDHWKIVTRSGGVVTAKDASDFSIGKSRHEAFTQLINLDAYADGVAG